MSSPIRLPRSVWFLALAVVIAAMQSTLSKRGCHCWTSSRSSSTARKRSSVRTYSVNYDPDNLFKGTAPRSGLIERRLLNKQMDKDKEFAKAVQIAGDEDRKKVLLRRQSRTPPTDHIELVEFFLNTDAEDMEFEVARCRPQLTADFFKQLDTMVGQERFAAKPDQDRLAELETLRQYLEEGKEAVDKAVQANISAVDRMKKLLSAKDKKAMILEMAEANEIDVALMDLLQQNIDAARMAAQEEPAQFMEKVKQAAAKFLVTQ
eukprot:GHRR01002666.1.p1 GENE.GHRR01002666.1~~GHRR01002666.1.p1  ORF type:complete len:263 (+),score=57.60 GHRR01002666.1:92-880(+)